MSQPKGRVLSNLTLKSRREKLELLRVRRVIIEEQLDAMMREILIDDEEHNEAYIEFAAPSIWDSQAHQRYQKLLSQAHTVEEKIDRLTHC